MKNNYKIKILFSIAIIAFIFILFSCNNISDEEKKSILVNKLTKYALKEKVNFEKVYFNINNISREKDEDLQKVEEFYQNPEKTFNEISEEEKGIEKLELFDAMYEKDQNKIQSCMENVDENLAQ